ncbi:MAG: HD domain-containing protein, partial [Cyclobacteriaceae bacterium]
DIGHGPFSHALEATLLKDVSHEHLSLKIMELLNQKFRGKLDLTIQIFKGKYHRKFFHQLVASQLDIDRLDYLNRDSFFTGVLEGTIGAERIIKMLTIKKDRIVVEEKGIYSIENFLSARRLMYWQVYLHKTTVSAEKMIIQLVSRAKTLLQKDKEIFCGPQLRLFLETNYRLKDFDRQPELLEAYASLDDFDIWGAIKEWQTHPDPILSGISKMLLTRNLFQIRMSNKPAKNQEIQQLCRSIQNKFKLERKDALCLLDHGTLSNAAYISRGPGINILHKDGRVEDIAQASDLPNIKAMSKIVKKYYLCWPKSVNL